MDVENQSQDKPQYESLEQFVESKLAEADNETSEDPKDQTPDNDQTVEASESQTETPTETENQGGDDQTETTSEAETEGEYKPDFTYTVLDEQKEFDDKIKQAITDKESEEYFRDLVTKAEGLDTYKEKLESKAKEIDTVNQEYQQTRAQYEQLQSSVNQLDQLSKQDFAMFQKWLEIPDKQILDRARQILELEQNPQQKQYLDTLHNDKIQGLKSQNQMQMLQQQNEQLMQRQHEFEVSQAMNQPEIQAFQRHFDQRLGEGAFRRHVEQFGAMEYQQKQRYVPPLEAVQQVYNQYKGLLGNENAMTAEPSNATPSQSQRPKNPREELKANPPTPPSNLGGGVNQTPTKRRVKTLDDLYKIADELEANQDQVQGF